MDIKYSRARKEALNILALRPRNDWIQCQHPAKGSPLNSRTLCSLYDDGYLERKVVTTWRKSSRRRINIVLYRLKEEHRCVTG